MQVLTPSGYKNIEDVNIGDDLIAYDINTGAVIINQLEGKTLWTPDMYPPDEIPGHYETVDVSYEEPETQLVWVEETVNEYNDEGEIIYTYNIWVQEEQVVIVTKYRQEEVWIDPVILRTSYEVFQQVNGDWKMYKINDTWSLFKDQSVWANMSVVHASQLQVGDIVYNDTDGDVVITSIEEVDVPKEWWKLDVSGDSSYIADGITLHNASRYWVGGGSSSNWNATGNTNWGSISGTQDNASVPTSADTVNFDGAGVAGNTNSTISAITTIGGYVITSGYTATLTHNFDLTVAGSITLGANYTIAGTGVLIISATGSFTSNGKTWPNGLSFSASSTTTLVGNLTINGLWTTVGSVSPTINSTTTETLTCGGGITFGNNCSPSGTAKHIATGGTLFFNGVSGSFQIPLDINGNITLNTFVFDNKAINYISGTVTVVANSTFSVGGIATVNLAGITFNNFSQSGNGTGYVTFTSSIVVNGLLGNNFARWNKTASETITVYGGITAGNNFMLGTMPVICKGGTISTGSNSGMGLPLTLDGNITFASNSFYCSGGTLKYLSGTNNASTTKLYVTSASSLDVGALTWNGVSFTGSNQTITLLSNLVSNATSDSTYGQVINKTTSEKFYTPGFTAKWVDGVRGTAPIQLTGGTWSATTSNAYISNDIEFNGNVSVSGTVYYQTGNLIYISGTISSVASGVILILSSTQTLSFNGGTNMLVPINFAGGTKTLSSNFVTSGLVTISGTTTINKTASETFTCNGGLTISSAVSGTATIVLTGGTWSHANTSAISNNLNIAGNVTISGNVYYGTNTITYVSGTPVVTGSTLNLPAASCTLNTNGMSWNNVTTGGATFTYTLISDLYINGFFNLPLYGNGANISKTTNENIYCYGGMTIAAYSLTTTANIYARGGSFTTTGNAGVTGTFFLDGNITIGATFNCPSFLTYLSGIVNTTGSTLNITLNTINTPSVLWNNVSFASGGNYSATIINDFIINGLLTVGSTSYSNAFNKTTNESVILYGGLLINGTSASFSGTANLVFKSGTWSQSANSSGLKIPTIIDGNITIGQNACINTGGVFTYKSGTLIGSNPINIIDNCSFIDFHKCPVKNIVVTSAKTITMNQFFTGTPSNPCSVTCATAGNTYNVTFTDTFEKIGTNVSVSGCVPTQPLQLILSSPFKINSLMATNRGIRYVNQSPNGFSKNAPAVTGLSTGPAAGLVSDPCFTKQV